ncbi:MAG TPA: peptide ABC transporter permease [Chloroflexi bacterium]|nr:peptide ABC transporter permease [Chloroflexota bacterium]
MTAEASSVAEMQVGAQRKRQIWRIITRNKATLLGLVLVLSIIAFATVGSLVSPYSPNKINPAEKLALPGEEHFLGTDQFGRDILSRLISGARVSLLVGVLSVALATVVGVTLGALTGFFGGWLDEGIMRGVDILMSFPYIILAIALAAALGPGFGNVILILSVIRIPVFARVSRAAVMAVTQQEYVLAATGIGQTRLNILFRHVLPNSLTAVIVVASLSVATAINAEAAISFLGLGIRPPQASWGNMLADAQLYILTAPWLGIAPGLLISLTVLGFNLLGDGLRDILDPRMRTS